MKDSFGKNLKILSEPIFLTSHSEGTDKAGQAEFKYENGIELLL